MKTNILVNSIEILCISYMNDNAWVVVVQYLQDFDRALQWDGRKQSHEPYHTIYKNRHFNFTQQKIQVFYVKRPEMFLKHNTHAKKTKFHFECYSRDDQSIIVSNLRCSMGNLIFGLLSPLFCSSS